jgi:exonuclease SbcD
MRLLHTSDWHLGQHFMGRSRQAEHQALIDWLLTQVQTHAVDAVLIAGDIFDTGAPPSYARELYNQLIVRLHDAGAALLILAGNHDSVSVLDESRELLTYLGAQVVSSTGDEARHVVTLPHAAQRGSLAASSAPCPSSARVMCSKARPDKAHRTSSRHCKPRLRPPTSACMPQPCKRSRRCRPARANCCPSLPPAI